MVLANVEWDDIILEPEAVHVKRGTQQIGPGPPRPARI